MDDIVIVVLLEPRLEGGGQTVENTKQTEGNGSVTVRHIPPTQPGVGSTFGFNKPEEKSPLPRWYTYVFRERSSRIRDRGSSLLETTQVLSPDPLTLNWGERFR